MNGSIKPSELFDQLARTWESESRDLGLRPNDATPPETFERRMREFWWCWEKACGGVSGSEESIKKAPPSDALGSRIDFEGF